MKSIKQRFKKAIFAFFKDEILKEFSVNNKYPEFTGKVYKQVDSTIKVELRQIGCTIDLDMDGQIPTDSFYEQACNKARKELFNEFIKWITIEGVVVLDPQYYHKRKIIFNAWVGIERK